MKAVVGMIIIRIMISVSLLKLKKEKMLVCHPLAFFMQHTIQRKDFSMRGGEDGVMHKNTVRSERQLELG